MKFFTFSLLFAFLLNSCGNSRRMLSEGSALKQAVRFLDKNPGDTAAKDQLAHLYKQGVQNHLANIEMYSTLTEPSKWNKILSEYDKLQDYYNIISSSATAKRLINPASYLAAREVTKEKAAEDYYRQGSSLLNQAQDIQNFRDAYNALNTANSYVPGYKDVKVLMNEARENSILNVVINPITDQTSYYRSLGYNKFGNSFNNDQLQRSLIRDLGGDYSKNLYARFYSDWEANRANVDIDWIVDITWTELYVPVPSVQRFSRKVSKEIQVGKDTTGKPTFEKVTGTLYITREYFQARGELESRVTDAHTRKNINLNRYASVVDWQQQYATYKGDPKALSDEDRSLIRNSSVRPPSKEEILNELYSKIYPQVRGNIQNLVR